MRMHYITILYTTLIVAAVGVAGLLLITVVPFPGIDLEARVVQSGSMEPALRTGSIVFIAPSERYTEGDVITYRRSARETPTTHRIIESRVENGVQYFTTKGDANEVRDMEEVREDEILGSVRFSIPFLGYVVDVARTPWGFVALIGIPTLIIIGSEMQNIWREIKRMRTDKKTPLTKKDNE